MLTLTEVERRHADVGSASIRRSRGDTHSRLQDLETGHCALQLVRNETLLLADRQLDWSGHGDARSRIMAG